MHKTGRPRLAVFASGAGTTFRAVADAIHNGLVDFDISLVISDREDAGVLEQVDEVNRLYNFAINKKIISRERYPDGPQGRGQTQAEAEATCNALRDHRIDHLALIGCLRIIAPQVIEAYGWKPEYAHQDPGNTKVGIDHGRAQRTLAFCLIRPTHSALIPNDGL